MVSTYISAVNQKLLFARQLLQMVESAGITSVSSHQAAAVTQSVVVQLHQAWLWHCRNVAESYKLKEVELVTDGDSLVALLAQQNKCPGEATELQFGGQFPERRPQKQVKFPQEARACFAVARRDKRNPDGSISQEGIIMEPVDYTSRTVVGRKRYEQKLRMS